MQWSWRAMADTEQNQPQRWRLSGTYRQSVVTIDPRQLVGRVALTIPSHIGRVAYLVLEIIRGLSEWRVWRPRPFKQAHNIGYGWLFLFMLRIGLFRVVVSSQA